MISLMNEIHNHINWLELMDELSYVPYKYCNYDYISNIDANKYKWGIPKIAYIHQKDKIREVFIYNNENSILQKIIHKILNKHFDNILPDNVFSYRKHVKTSDAVRNIKDGLDKYAYKLDISNYFLSVKRELIDKSINELISDEDGKLLLNNLFSISEYIDKGDVKQKYLGIMPGCAVSVFFANYILIELDKIMSKTCSIYARYSDDMILYNSSFDKLQDSKSVLEFELNKYDLCLHPNKMTLYKPYSKIDFLGLTIDKESKIDINNKNFLKIKGIIKKMCKKERKKIEMEGKSVDKSLTFIIKKFNRLFFKWGRREDKRTIAEYIFSVIETISTIQQIDFYLKDNLKYIVTGKHNKANDRLQIDYDGLGWKSLCVMFHLYKLDKDIYRNEVDLL